MPFVYYWSKVAPIAMLVVDDTKVEVAAEALSCLQRSNAESASIIQLILDFLFV